MRRKTTVSGGLFDIAVSVGRLLSGKPAAWWFVHVTAPLMDRCYPFSF